MPAGEPSETLATHWTLLPAERALLGNKAGATRLGFALLLKFFECHGRFPDSPAEVPPEAVVHLARQVGVPPEAHAALDWSARAAKYHRAQIRVHLGVREPTVADGRELVIWLSERVAVADPGHEAFVTLARERLRELRIEPPGPARMHRLLRSAFARAEQCLQDSTLARLLPATRQALDALVETAADGEMENNDANAAQGSLFAPAASAFGELKGEAGAVSVETVLAEVDKLRRLRALALPEDLFAGAAPQLVHHYRRRAATEAPRDLRRHPPAVRYTLLAAFARERTQEITDALAELLMAIAHRINVRAETRVDAELLENLRKVTGKTGLLFRLAEAAIGQPGGVIREVLFPVVGEETLQNLVREHHASGPAYARRVRTVMRASYGHHYRRVIPVLLEVLEFRSNNAAHQPLIRALDLLRRYRERRTTAFAHGEDVPLHGVVREGWRDFILETGHGEKENGSGDGPINRVAYEVCVLAALRERLRCKEVWVAGARRFRNPEEDLPQDFEARREEHCARLRQPAVAGEFVRGVWQRMRDALTALDAVLPGHPQVRVRASRAGRGHLSLSPLEALPEPPNLDRLKAALVQRWPMTNLVDILKEAELRVGFTEVFRGAGAREVLGRDLLQRRLLLTVHGLGTNAGLKRVCSGGTPDRYADLLYVRRRYLGPETLRAAIARVCDAIFRVRQTLLWGEGTTACASDSKQFGAWDQNLLTEWHARYGGRGVLIYWHVETKSTCIHSQLKNCSSSEVAAMIEGVLRHETEMEVEKNYVDSHGQSEIGFAFCHLLGFQLLPRLKNLKSQRLYRPDRGEPQNYPALQPLLTRPIAWELIEEQYDQLLKYATALRLGTADAESILRRFTRANVQHPTYRALAELGKALKTIFLCDYLRLEGLRREIHEGLQVIETWNSANDFIFYGKGGELASNRREDQEVSILCLHLLQVCLVYVNTLMIQQVLAEPDWRNRLTDTDRRALCPLLWAHVNPYGTFTLNMGERLPLETVAT